MRRPSNERGQAIVEMALSLLVFVTVLIFGIHFAEVGYLSVKVSEAGAAAAWDVTGRQVHQRATDFSPRFGALDAAQTSTQARYQDFDGVGTGGSSLTQIFTRAERLRVHCGNEPNLHWQPVFERPRTGISFVDPQEGVPAPDLLRPVMARYDDAGGISCKASAELTPFGFPLRFEEQGNGFMFSAQHYLGPLRMKICSIGRADGPGCPGKLPVLVGDWSLQGAGESTSNDLYAGGNTVYKNLVQSSFGSSACGAAEALSQVYGDNSACGFWFSYQGEERGYRQAIGGARDTEGMNPWNTGGADWFRTATGLKRDYLYLGVPWRDR